MAFKENVDEIVIYLIMIGLLLVIGFGLFEPAILWLGSGVFPERDLWFWFHYDDLCSLFLIITCAMIRDGRV